MRMIADDDVRECDVEDLLLERDTDRYRVAPCPTRVKDETPMNGGYLVVVPATDLALFEYLEQRFKGDPATSVLVERRKTPRPAPRAVVLVHGVTVVRLGDPPPFMTARISPRPDDRRQTMSEIDLEDRQRVDRWLEESQYLLGRLIPGYLDERERLKTRLAGSEADCDRLRHELEGLRREVASLVAELQHHRNEQAATAEAFSVVLGQLSDLQKPLNEVHRRLQSVHAPVMNGVYTHA
jgi:hypothetical protein